MNKILETRAQALKEITEAKDLPVLDQLKIKLFGRKGTINQLLKGIPELPQEERQAFGQQLNETKINLKKALNEQQKKLVINRSKKEAWQDITLPGIKPPEGHLHLVSQAIEEISEIFEKIGFVRVRYPEVEWDWYAFEGLNMPKNHPARDEWETFFVEAPLSGKKGRMVLTPHTSSGQLREMERTKPPIRMINIAKCHRRQQDLTHTAMFHQFEGLLIDKDVNIGHLKGVTDYFAEQFYGQGRKTRLRPFHFQFTEPSFEIDINCPLCLGKGCKTCKSGWHELGGAGMVHPNVLKAGGIDPEKYTGFAFGWGVERTYMMKTDMKIDDLRFFYSNDLRFLSQF